MKVTFCRQPRRGFVLVIVLVVIVALSLTAYAFTELMLTHNDAARLTGRQRQAAAALQSGVDVTRMLLMSDRAERLEMGGFDDNPEIFQGVNVVDDADVRFRANYTIVAPGFQHDADPTLLRFGLVDESSKLNINMLLTPLETSGLTGSEIDELAVKRLMALPGMTDEIADAILDWLDADDEAREYGAEIEYYSELNPPYVPKNGPLASVEELLLVRGMLPEYLFGLDINRNGVLDPHEVGSNAETVVSTATGEIPPLGWAAYLTLHSAERNMTFDGQPRININQDDLQTLHDELTDVFDRYTATFIVAHRQNGPVLNTNTSSDDHENEDEADDEESDTATMTDGPLDLSRSARSQFENVLALIDARVRVRYQDAEEEITIVSPFVDPESTDMQNLLDRLTVYEEEAVVGRININRASRHVLLGLPGMTDEIVDQIVENRNPSPSQSAQLHPSWILKSGFVTSGEMEALLPFLNGGGDVHTAQIIGYYEGLGPFSRAEVMIDATPAMPRVIQFRDLTHLGRGFPVSTLGANAVNGGTANP